MARDTRRLEQAAVTLASRGYFVFPARPRDKLPITANGFNDATRDERTILTWWDRWPNANIAVACGASGIVVLDIDSKAGVDPDAILLGLQVGDDVPILRTGEAIPDDQHPEALQGVRGAHLVYRGSRSTTTQLTIPGTEIRGAGAYIIVPPSVHPSGVEYLGELPPVERLPAMPDWVNEIVVTGVNGNGSPADPVPDVIGRNRNVTLTSMAGTMRRRGAEREEILAALRSMNERRCRPPLDDAEVQTIATSVAKYPPHRAQSDLSDLTVPEWLQNELEQAGVSDEDIDEAGSLKDLMKLIGGGKDTVATRLVALVLEQGVELFHDEDDKPFATFTVDGHEETWQISSQQFENYVRHLFYATDKAAPNGQAIRDALGVLAAKALFEGEQHPVHIRISGDALRLVIDLGDPDWRAIEVTRTGWRLLDRHPVKFRRSGAMQPLPVPIPGGDLDRLRPFVNVAGDEDWQLVVGWLLAALRPGYPYPVLLTYGEQGSAKSTLCRVLRALVDPNSSALRVAPHDVDDLMVSARNSWVVAYDNVSKIPPSLSDAICRLSTGGGLSKRQLYTDAEEVLLDAMRPVVLNGIDVVAHRSDLLDRALLVEMPVIPEGERKREDVFWAEFANVHADVLGGLLDALVVALARVHEIRLERLPRMADFAVWVAAAAPALGWADGAFLASYTGNRAQAHDVAIESSPIGPALLAVAKDGFEGTTSMLLERLTEQADENATSTKDWPKNASALRTELDRLAPNLRALGYEVKRSREGNKRTRTVTIRRRPT